MGINAETRKTVYEDTAGLLTRMGYLARAEVDWVPPNHSRPVMALITDAPEMVVGYALALTAEDPEAHLPPCRDKGGRVPKGQTGGPMMAYFGDRE